MINLQRLIPIAKIYISAALVASAVISPPALSVVPVVLLFWYLYEWRWPVSPMIDLLTQYFLYFALALLFSAFMPSFLAPLLSWPVLIAINDSLEKKVPTTVIRNTRFQHRLTSTAIASFSLVLLVLIFSIVLFNLSLLLSSIVILLYFAVLSCIVYKRLPLIPITAAVVQQRILAGKEEHFETKINILTRLGRLLVIESPYGWVKVRDNRMLLKYETAILPISVTPLLSGPRVIKLNAHLIDRWGLMQVSFTLEPVKLYVIPRARYAIWLARRYLAGTGSGTLPLLSNVGTLKALHGLRQGIEYYGNRLYQPGDSLKTIDWKHTSKFNKLITKEFTEFRGQPAILLVNLEANNFEEADKLAYNIIATAITLGQENIPAALAVYNHEKVLFTTAILSFLELMVHSLQTIKGIHIMNNPTKYLTSPDPFKLKANIKRLSQSGGPAARALEDLLKLESKLLNENARENPCTQALSSVMAKSREPSNLVILSQRNHDAEALALNSFVLSQRGMTVINI